MASAMESERFRFGLFEFDTAAMQLRRDGALIHLQAQPKQVLAFLIANADRAVSREELRKWVWGDQTFVDFERGLNFCIAQIRKALGDDAAKPLYIRTFAKQGYQFIAPVESISEQAPTEVQGTIPGWLKQRPVLAGFAVGLLVLLAFSAGHVLRSSPLPKKLPVVAIVRFDNETGNPDVIRFSDGLTDNLVERLISLSSGRYLIIGNAQILRRPREERDLNAIAASLHANYVILGQVQANGAQTRILAHLIRMPEQTHIWVVRLDRALADPLTANLTVESEIAQSIADQFCTRMAYDASNPATHSVANH
jgi:DNA-binding winged helix-turn-helix (wHTH) protein/TolB-like protein